MSFTTDSNKTHLPILINGWSCIVGFAVRQRVDKHYYNISKTSDYELYIGKILSHCPNFLNNDL